MLDESVEGDYVISATIYFMRNQNVIRTFVYENTHSITCICIYIWNIGWIRNPMVFSAFLRIFDKVSQNEQAGQR